MSTDPFPSNRELGQRFPLAALPDSNITRRDDVRAHERCVADLEIRIVAAVGIHDPETAAQCSDRAKLHRIRRLEILRKALA